MKIIHKNGEKIGQFIAMDGDNRMGEVFYSWTEKDKFTISHTGVRDEFAGLGVGKKLVMAAVEYARKNNLKIKPLCPFAAKIFKENKELDDLVF
ncbi:GNAT family N-acetyltransferase [Peptostreptococcus faecalis]|uniref:GNAT family N-acetyltransferase n=1 Tax=Peptostreptococcus faecalis TaxID=2045015 RepID=UPI000C7E7270|nr:GNAT family N-acetyltransferase [Peptostreptococcus faecalis]